MNTVKRIMTNPSGSLHLIFKHCQSIQKIDKIFRASLPHPLEQHCYVANLRDKTLIIHADSSLWATHLRYMTPEILRSWHNNPTMPVIQHLKIRIRAKNFCYDMAVKGCK